MIEVAFGYKIYKLTPAQKWDWDQAEKLSGLSQQTRKKLELLVEWKLEDTGVRDVKRALELSGRS